MAKTLNSHLFDALERISNANAESIDLEMSKAASLVTISEQIIEVAQMKLNIINAGLKFNEFSEISDEPKQIKESSTSTEDSKKKLIG